MSTPKHWLWPNHAISKRESAVLRTEHNEVVNEHAELQRALKDIVNCPDYRRVNTHEMIGARSLLWKIEHS